MIFLGCVREKIVGPTLLCILGRKFIFSTWVPLLDAAKGRLPWTSTEDASNCKVKNVHPFLLIKLSGMHFNNDLSRH